MKNFFLSFFTFVVFIFTANVYSQAVGDFGSAGTGNWGTTGANWIVCTSPGTWAGATTPAPNVPASTNNVWIRSGHTVTVEVSPKVFNNMTVESGASLVAVNSLPTSSLRYIRIYGSTLTNNGNIGSSTDVLGLSLYGGSGQVATVTGTGTTNFSRVQQNSTGTSIIFDANVNLNYAGSGGAGSTALYVSTSGNTFSVTINAGRTVTMAPSAYISGTTSSGSTAASSTISLDIYGTLVTQSNSIINLNVNTPHTSTLIVRNGGSINLGSLLRTNTGTGVMTVDVQNGGTINGLAGSSYDMSLATTTVNGTVDFGVSTVTPRDIGTATVGATGKLRFQDGTYPTGSVTLNSGSTVEYYGSSPITLGASPTAYSNLSVSNSAGVTLGAALAVSNLFSILSGSTVDLSTYTHTAEYLQLAGVDQTPGTHGSTASTATYQNATYFGTSATGILIVNAALPVELTSFTASVGNNGVILKWITKTETNNYGWDVEVRNTSEATWQKVGFVNGAGNSNSPKEYSFVDKQNQSGKYFYRLKQIDGDGRISYSNEVSVDVQAPQAFSLDQNYPNPFNPSTTINYSLPIDSRVSLELYSLVGEKVADLVNEAQVSGFYSYNFNTSNLNLTSGVYLYKLTAVSNSNEVFSQSMKMLLLK